MVPPLNLAPSAGGGYIQNLSINPPPLLRSSSSCNKCAVHVNRRFYILKFFINFIFKIKLPYFSTLIYLAFEMKCKYRIILWCKKAKRNKYNYVIWQVSCMIWNGVWYINYRQSLPKECPKFNVSYKQVVTKSGK